MVTPGPFLQDSQGDFARLRCWEQRGLALWRKRENLLSPWVAFGDKMWLDGKQPPGALAAHVL